MNIPPKIKDKVAAAAKSLQSCPTHWDPMDCSLPGSPIPGILQARTLERVAVSLSNAWKWKVKVKSLSRVRLFATPWTAAYQGFFRQEYWSGVPLPSPLSASSPQYLLKEWLKGPVAAEILKRNKRFLTFDEFCCNRKADM